MSKSFQSSKFKALDFVNIFWNFFNEPENQETRDKSHLLSTQYIRYNFRYEYVSISKYVIINLQVQKNGKMYFLIILVKWKIFACKCKTIVYICLQTMNLLFL